MRIINLAQSGRRDSWRREGIARETMMMVELDLELFSDVSVETMEQSKDLSKRSYKNMWKKVASTKKRHD